MDVLLRTRLPLKGLAISTSQPHSPARESSTMMHLRLCRSQHDYQPQTVCIAVRKGLAKKDRVCPAPPHSFRVAVRLSTQQINDTRRNRATTQGIVTASGTIAATGPGRLPPAPPLVLNFSPRIARNSYQQHRAAYLGETPCVNHALTGSARVDFAGATASRAPQPAPL